MKCAMVTIATLIALCVCDQATPCVGGKPYAWGSWERTGATYVFDSRPQVGRKCEVCGWPEGMADLKDCELIEKATPEERDKLLRDWAKPGDREKNRDHRHLYADARLTEEEKATK